MLRQIQFSVVLLSSLLLFASCQTAQKYIESGNYDGAIGYCISKLRGKKNKKVEYVQGLEMAFKKATERDMRLVDNLIAAGREENWAKINSIHRNIKSRQDKISPLLPLRSKDGYQASFKFVNIERLEQSSRERAAEYLYDCAEDLIQQGANGDREAAREAYGKLQELKSKYFQDFRNVDQLMAEASQLGTTYVLFQIGNQSNQVLPGDFNERILAFNTRDLNSRWKEFHFSAQRGVDYHYQVKFNIRSVDISPERVNERIYTDEKEIEDGWKYVLDDKGNVKKDSLGNDVKAKRYAIVRADIVEVLQTKAVRMIGNLEIYNSTGTNRLDSHEMSTEVLFEHYASTFQGDRRALSEQSRRRIGNRPVPFPQNSEMLAQAADNLKPQIREELKSSRSFY
ncbi:MAG: hypothetical protein R2792_17990 [Saprospiraceae bacterium]